MANTAYTVEPLELMDGQVFNLRPLPIKYYRIANNKMLDLLQPAEDAEELTEAQMEEELFNITVFCLKSLRKDWPADYDFEEAVDYDTIYKIIAICTGIDLKKTSEALANVDREVLAQMMAQQKTNTTREPGTTDSQN